MGLGPYGGDYCNCDSCDSNHTVSIAVGLRNALAAAGTTTNAQVHTAVGCTDGRNGTSTKGFAAALALARSESVSHIVLAVGLDGVLEGEGSDRLRDRFPRGLYVMM